MIAVDIKGIEGVKKRLSSIAAELREKAIVPAINKTAAKARTEINRAITQEYYVKATEVRSAIDLRGANRSNLAATISIFGSKSRRGRSANMIHFLAVMQAAGIAIKSRGAKVTRKQAKQVGKQLGLLIRRGSGVKQIQGAFIGNKGRTVFMREGKGRLPIKPVQVIGFSQMFNSNRIRERVLRKIDQEFPIEMDRAIKMILARA